MRMTEHGFGRKGLRQNFRTCEHGFKVFNQVGNRQYFQLVEKKKYFA